MSWDDWKLECSLDGWFNIHGTTGGWKVHGMARMSWDDRRLESSWDGQNVMGCLEILWDAGDVRGMTAA